MSNSNKWNSLNNLKYFKASRSTEVQAPKGARPPTREGEPKTPKYKTHCYRVVDDWVGEICSNFDRHPRRDAFANAENNRFPRYWDAGDHAMSKHW